MDETTLKPKIITSDPDVLHKIKFMQFRRQVIPLIVVVLFMVVNIFLALKIVLYMSIAAFGWYLLERVMFRTKNKIAAPEADSFVSPVDGKVLLVRKGLEATLITISKTFFDVVELRLPYPDLQTEIVNNWNFETLKGRVIVKVKSEKAKYFDNHNIPGSVIGVLPGNAIITVQVPAGIKILVSEKQNVFGGESVLFSLAIDAETVPVYKSILVEE